MISDSFSTFLYVDILDICWVLFYKDTNFGTFIGFVISMQQEDVGLKALNFRSNFLTCEYSPDSGAQSFSSNIHIHYITEYILIYII